MIKSDMASKYCICTCAIKQINIQMFQVQKCVHEKKQTVVVRKPSTIKKR